LIIKTFSPQRRKERKEMQIAYQNRLSTKTHKETLGLALHSHDKFLDFLRVLCVFAVKGYFATW
jgi:hypothetical protein